MCRELHEDEDFYGPVMGRLWVSYEPAMVKLRSQKKVSPKILSFCHPKDDQKKLSLLLPFEKRQKDDKSDKKIVIFRVTK